MASPDSQNPQNPFPERGWAFTDWNVTQERILFYYHWFNHQMIRTFYPNVDFTKNHWKANIEYLVLAREVCPTTKKEHLQGFIYFHSKRTFDQAWAAFTKSPGHKLSADGKATVRLGKKYGQATPFDNMRYCKKGHIQTKKEWEELKDKGPNYGKGLILWDHNKPLEMYTSTCWEYGNCPTGAGHRSDIDEVYGKVKKHELTNFEEISDANPHLAAQYSKFWDRALESNRLDRDHSKLKSVIAYHGESGAGKSYLARHFQTEGKEAKYDSLKFSGTKENPFVHGYTGQNIVLLDDFDPETVSFQWFLTFTDRYTVNINIKGGSTKFTADYILITTNRSPLTWFPTIKDEERLKAFIRRFTSFVEVKRPKTLPPIQFPERYEVSIIDPGTEIQKIETKKLADFTTEDLMRELAKRNDIPIVSVSSNQKN